MADMVTKQELEEAKIDVKHAGEAVNTKKVITPRYGAPFKSLPLVAAEAQAKADEVVAQGFYRGYTTEALLLAAKPAVAEMRARADDTRKIYRWNRTSAEGVTPVTGNWVDTGLSDLDLAKADATTKANAAKAEAIAAASSDATAKANTAKSEAIIAAATDANEYTDSALTAIVNRLNAAGISYGDPRDILIGENLITRDAVCAYFFDEGAGDFIDESRHARHIALGANSPARHPHGVHLTTGKSIDLPNLAYKTLVIAHYIPKDSEGGMLYSANSGSTLVAARFRLATADGKFFQLSKLRQNAQKPDISNTYWSKGYWYISAFELGMSPTTLTRIGASRTDAATETFDSAYVAAIVGFDRTLTIYETAQVHNLIAERIRGRGLPFETLNMPVILEGVSAPNAETWVTGIPSPYEPQDELTHPSVLDMETEMNASGARWNGYRYWMAVTPYPGGSDPAENPSIFASNDLDTWVVPSEVVNPIVPWPTYGYNSDPNLAWDPDNETMHLVWRRVTSSTGGGDAVGKYIFHSSSKDGWSTRTPDQILVYSSTDQLLSPSIFWDGSMSKWRLYCANRTWFRDAESFDRLWNPLNLWEADAPAGPFTFKRQCQMPPFYPMGGRGIWHFDIFRDERVGGYLCLASVTNNGASNAVSPAVALTSRDGEQWYVPEETAFMERNSFHWDGDKIYKIAAVRTPTGYEVIYSAFGDPDGVVPFRHRMGRTSFTLK